MPAAREIGLDLLVVGGGIQGLTLLDHFVEEGRGSALLVTRDPLGTGETLHSHGYLHRGHFLPPEGAAMVPAVRESFDWWDAWMGRHGIRYGDASPVLYDLAEDQLESVTGAWREAGLDFEPLDALPAALLGGSYSRAAGRRLVRIHDRLIPPWEIVGKLGAPVQDLLLQGEVTGLEWDAGSNRIAGCTVNAGGEEVRFRPRCVVLAAGREIQPLVRRIRGPEGSRPFDGTLRDLNRIRDVPMILIRGAALPGLSGWFFLEAPITMMSHTAEDGEPMWVVTLMGGHRTTRGDFAGEAGDVDGDTIRETLRALSEMVPALKARASDLRFSSYLGAKIDHPEALQRWYVGDAGIGNLRFVWPVLWGLSHGASRAVLEDLSRSGLLEQPGSRPGVRFDAGRHGLRTGVEAGGEKRLAASRRWHTLREWRSAHRIEL